MNFTLLKGTIILGKKINKSHLLLLDKIEKLSIGKPPFCLASNEKLAKEMNISEKTLKRYMSFLESIKILNRDFMRIKGKNERVLMVDESQIQKIFNEYCDDAFPRTPEGFGQFVEWWTDTHDEEESKTNLDLLVGRTVNDVVISDRHVELLKIFQQTDNSYLNVSEIIDKSGLPERTIYRYINALKKINLIKQDASTLSLNEKAILFLLNNTAEDLETDDFQQFTQTVINTFPEDKLFIQDVKTSKQSDMLRQIERSKKKYAHSKYNYDKLCNQYAQEFSDAPVITIPYVPPYPHIRKKKGNP